ncbi:MAG: hypothetical protein IRY83_14640, partial [Chloroflexi bacterium]|nr:hypothetical protein [Chloroflexota bacterium]
DAQRDLFHQSLDLVLFDTTSTYFEGVRLEGFARMESALRRLLKEQGLLLRWYEVMDALRSVRAIDLELAGQRYLVRTELGADAARVFQAAGVRPPSQVTPL